MLTKISEEITDMKALNSILQDEDYDTYEVSPTIKFSKISALRLGIDTHFKVPFLAGDGYIKFNGEEILKSETQLITRIRCDKSNTKLLFGNGFPNVRSFIHNMKK
jgi:hypothetical protein